MARLVLKFEDQVLKDAEVGAGATIGRLPDNSIVVDNPAVSGHHARVFREGDQYVVEDLGSTNGTFVNENRVSRHVLHDGDVLLIGKHKITLDASPGSGSEVAAPSKAEPAAPTLGDTMFLDTKKHRELIAKIRSGNEAPASNGQTRKVAEKVGVLHVIGGKADQSEYPLEARTCLIGKAPTSSVRLKGWFKPRVAVAITRNRDGYTATVLAGKTTINSELGSGRHDLKDGDVLAVSGLTLEFRWRESAAPR